MNSDRKSVRPCRSAPLRLSRTEWPLVDGGSLRLLSDSETRELLHRFGISDPCSLKSETREAGPSNE